MSKAKLGRRLQRLAGLNTKRRKQPPLGRYGKHTSSFFPKKQHRAKPIG